jgi:hypothetical protein
MVTSPEPAHADIDEPDISDLVTEDDTPVDNIYSEKQQRLLTEPLFSGWGGPPPLEDGARRRFVALANVGVFSSTRLPPIVPDVLLSADVGLHPDIFEKKHRTYFVWEFGKTPDVVIEVVSNTEGGELGAKKNRYAVLRVPYYVVWDPGAFLGDTALHAFELHGSFYRPMTAPSFAELGLRLVVWSGVYEDFESTWLRWATLDGAVIPTGAESARVARTEAEVARTEAEAARTEAEAARTEAGAARTEAEAARTEAEAARERAERLAARLRALGIEPDEG